MKDKMKKWVKWMLGDSLFKKVENNMALLIYIAFLLTFLVINSYSGMKKCERLVELEATNKSLRWEYLQMKAEYTSMRSRKVVVPEGYSEYVSVPIKIKND